MSSLVSYARNLSLKYGSEAQPCILQMQATTEKFLFTTCSWSIFCDDVSRPRMDAASADRSSLCRSPLYSITAIAATSNMAIDFGTQELGLCSAQEDVARQPRSGMSSRPVLLRLQYRSLPQMDIRPSCNDY
jgi:hypothetical protein